MNNMGGEFSLPKPAAPPLRVDDPYPDTQGAEGISLSTAQACAKCELAVAPGISSSTAKLTRLFGTATPEECNNFHPMIDKTVQEKLPFSEFKGLFKAGKLMESKTIDGEVYCQVRGFKDETQDSEAVDIYKIGAAYNNKELPVVRVRKQATGGGFSLDTKAMIKPSIPFKMTFNNEDIPINTMTLYHPCPVRIDAVQADAVLSLNDPGEGTPKYVVLVPLVLSNAEEPSVKFFNKIVPSTSMIAEPNPITGQYSDQDVPTGNDWALTQLFAAKQIASGKFLVDNGYFVWEGIPSLERYKSRDDGQVVQTSWRRAGSAGPTYILLEKPLQIGGTDLATLIQSLPVTPTRDAIHPVPTSGIVYKQGPPSGCSAAPAAPSTKEHYTELSAGESCDPFLNNALKGSVGEKQFTPQKFWSWMFSFLIGVVMFIGAYIAVIVVLGEGDQTVKLRAEDVGKIAAVWAKNMSQKVSNFKSNVSAGSFLPGTLGTA